MEAFQARLGLVLRKNLELKCVCRTHVAEPVVSMFFTLLPLQRIPVQAACLFDNRNGEEGISSPRFVQLHSTGQKWAPTWRAE